MASPRRNPPAARGHRLRAPSATLRRATEALPGRENIPHTSEPGGPEAKRPHEALPGDFPAPQIAARLGGDEISAYGLYGTSGSAPPRPLWAEEMHGAARLAQTGTPQGPTASRRAKDGGTEPAGGDRAKTRLGRTVSRPTHCMRACLAAFAAARLRVLYQPLRCCQVAAGLRFGVPEGGEPSPAAGPEESGDSPSPECIVCKAPAKGVGTPAPRVGQVECYRTCF